MKTGLGILSEGIESTKNVLIVGGSSGIGEATAEKFIKEGYSVTNVSRTECKVEGVVNVLCDVTDNDRYDKILQDFVNKTSTLAALVYSAGFSMAAPLEHVEESDYKYLFEVNFFGYLKTLKAVLPLLRRAGGTSCVISSIAAVQPIAYDCFYTASKAALNGLTAALRYELNPLGVNAVSVMPGGTKTRFTFKRKIYPSDSVGDYSSDMANAVVALHDVEQNGVAAKTVADTVFGKCTYMSASHTFASGLVNKIIFLLSRILPQSASYAIGTKLFFNR